MDVRRSSVRAAWKVSVLAVAAAFAGAAWTATGPATEEKRAAAPALMETKTVLENDRVRAHLLVYPAGSMSPEHDHAYPRLAVALSGGRLLVQAADGALRSVALRPGDTVWLRPERHRVSNPGPDEVRLVEIDLLDCPVLTR